MIQIGDIVVCWDNANCSDLSVGFEYVVLGIKYDGQCIKIRDSREEWWYDGWTSQLHLKTQSSPTEQRQVNLDKSTAEDCVSLVMTNDSATRKTYPVYSGFVKYFPDAMAMVAHHSYKGNEQHNPGSELHWDRSKSGDELDALIRHILEGEWESVAWRAMAHLQKQIEAGYRAKD